MARGIKFFIEKEKLQELYKQHKTISAVAKVLNVTTTAIRNSMIKYNLSWTPRLLNTCDNNYFSGDSPAEFYHAGFLLADGCAHKMGKYSYCTILGLSIKDISHLEKFKQALQSTAKIGIYASKKSKTSIVSSDEVFPQATITIVSKNIFNNLARFNVIPNKTLICEFPEWVADHKNCSHFCRGLIDGDGWYTIKKTKRGFSPTVGLCGTKKLVSKFRDVINKNVLFEEMGSISKGRGQNHYQLTFSGPHTVKKIINYLYNNTTLDIYLDRKKEIVDQIMSMETVIQSTGKPDLLKLEDLSKDNLIKLYEKHRSLRGMAREAGHERDIIKAYLAKYNLNFSFTRKNQFD